MIWIGFGILVVCFLLSDVWTWFVLKKLSAHFSKKE